MKLVISGTQYKLTYGGDQATGQIDFIAKERPPKFLFHPEAGGFSNLSKSHIEQKISRVGGSSSFLSDFERLHMPFAYEVAQEWNVLYIIIDHDGTHFRKRC